MAINPLQLLLADDDEDDCLFFRQALYGLSIATHLTTVHNGEQLMQQLTAGSTPLPDAIFLDLNMPRKNGFECLSDIKSDETLRLLPVFILSTYFDQEVADQLYKDGALACLRKPTDFSQLKQLIQHALSQVVQKPVSTVVNDPHTLIKGVTPAPE